MTVADDFSCGTLRQLIEQLEIGILILDRDQKIVHWNQWFSLRSGMNLEEVRGQSLFFAFPDALGTRLSTAVDQAVQHGFPALLSTALHGNLLPLYQSETTRHQEKRLQQMTHVLPMPQGEGPAACLIQISDVTANISRERLWRQQAEHLKRRDHADPLTGALKRQHFDTMLTELFQRSRQHAEQISLLVVDIDHFSSFNALYGRRRGDELLAELAHLLAEQLRHRGDLLCRYGAEEFAIAMAASSADDACKLAESLRQAVTALRIRHEQSPTAPHLTISIGISSLQIDEQSTPSTLLSSAEVALYQAKHEGRNRSVFFSVDSGKFRTFP